MNTAYERRQAEVQAIPLPSERPAHMDERGWNILLWRHEGMTLEAIGETLGITRERVRQLEARALTRLGHAA